jgi:hypothetical protein
MRLYIPAAKHAAHMCLKRNTPADRARWDAVEDAISAAARQLFDAITTGEAAEAHQIYTSYYPHLIVYTRSNRPGVKIQASHFYKSLHTGGAWTATSHHNINSPEDIELIPGQYLTIMKGA